MGTDLLFLFAVKSMAHDHTPVDPPAISHLGSSISQPGRFFLLAAVINDHNASHRFSIGTSAHPGLAFPALDSALIFGDDDGEDDGDDDGEDEEDDVETLVLTAASAPNKISLHKALEVIIQANIT